MSTPRIDPFRNINRPARDIMRIRGQISNRFEDRIKIARDFGVRIRFNRTRVEFPQDLAAEVAKNRLENDAMTLDLFDRAIILSSLMAQKHTSYPFHYELNLGSLAPAFLSARGYSEKVGAILQPIKLSQASTLLREIGALKRLYAEPLAKFRHEWELWRTPEMVNKMVGSWFGNYLRSALNEMIALTLRYNSSEITDVDSFSQILIKHGLQKKGQLLFLFKKALYVAIVVARANTEKPLKFSLNLGALNYANLKRNGIQENDIENLMETRDIKKVAETLFKVGAFQVNRLDEKPDKGQRSLFIPYVLNYPQ